MPPWFATATTAAAWLAVAALTSACPSSFDHRSLPPAPEPGAAPEPIADASLYIPGEYLAWSVKWKGLAGGVTRWVIGQPGTLDGRSAIIARSETRSDGLVAVFRHVREEITTTIDLATGGPTRSESLIEHGRTHETLDVSFNDGGYHAKMILKDEGEERVWDQPLARDGDHVDDLHTAMSHLRLWQPDNGTRGYLYAQSGQSFYELVLVAAGRETLTTDAGTFETVRLEGTATQRGWRGEPPKQPKLRRFTIWVSEDSYRLPVRIVGETTFGDVYAELTEFLRPEGAQALVLKHSAH